MDLCVVFRYWGEEEFIDLIVGYILGVIFVLFVENLGGDGCFKFEVELR